MNCTEDIQNVDVDEDVGDGELKRHLKQLVALQEQEKEVENGISKLKADISEKMDKKGMKLNIDDTNHADALAGSTILDQNGQILDTKLGESAIANVQALSKITKKLNGTKFIKWRIENHGKQTIIIL